MRWMGTAWKLGTSQRCAWQPPNGRARHLEWQLQWCLPQPRQRKRLPGMRQVQRCSCQSVLRRRCWRAGNKRLTGMNREAAGTHASHCHVRRTWPRLWIKDSRSMKHKGKGSQPQFSCHGVLRWVEGVQGRRVDFWTIKCHFTHNFARRYVKQRSSQPTADRSGGFIVVDKKG